jgi:Skp family chaperone for outer membrane proteins
MRLVPTVLLALAVTLCAGHAQAPQNPSGVLLVDPPALFERTILGQRLRAENDESERVLEAENRSIERELISEERELTDMRPTLSVEEFRTLADAFDEKVNRIRSEQDEKARALQGLREEGQKTFFARIGPILYEIVRERNAAVLIDRRNIFLAADTIDITQAAIARIDARFGDGTDTGE